MNDSVPGHSIDAQVFEPAEMARTIEALGRGGNYTYKGGGQACTRVPVVRELSEDPRLTQIAARFVGSRPVPFRATLFDKSPASNWLVAWHQDTALPLRRRVDDSSWGPWSVKAGVVYAHAPAWALATVIALRVHLDNSTTSRDKSKESSVSRHREGSFRCVR